MRKNVLLLLALVFLLSGCAGSPPVGESLSSKSQNVGAGQGLSTWAAMTYAIADTDLFGITDVSDTTQSSDGSSRRVTGTQVKTWLGLGGSGTITVDTVNFLHANTTAADGSRVSLLPNNTSSYTVTTGQTGLVNESNVIKQFLNGGTKYALLDSSAIGSTVQAYDADLTTWAGITPGTGVGTFLATPSSANLASAVTDETGTGALVFGTGPAIAVAEVDGHASASLTAAQVSSTIVYNTGMGAGDVALTLPTAAAGYSALFTVATAQSNKWGVRAGTNDKIYLIAADGTISAGSDNGYARMTAAQAGQSFACWTFKTDAYDWMCKAIAIGSSTFAAN